MRRRYLVLFALLGLTLAAEVIFVPVEGVLVSIPHATFSSCSSDGQCTITVSYYRGGGSLAYCLLGDGALYVDGVYYPIIQPSASLGREVSLRFCPAMK